ncbi:MAG: transglutaminase family protein, partial [Bacteroidota bacterium]
FLNWMQDPFGNYQARVVFEELTKEFSIDVEVIADMVSINPFDFFLDEYAEKFPFTYEKSLTKELQPYLEINESGPFLRKCFDECQQFKNQNTVDFLVAINQYIYQQLNYTIRLETGVQTCEETLGKKLGSCRDFAWVLVQLLRHFGLAARFVSGYLVQLKSDVKAIDGPSGPEADFTDLHAWAEVFIPGAGWIGLDATSGLFAGEGHIPLACTPSTGSAAPITGFTEPTKVDFEFSNVVERIYESPRVTKPYTKAQFLAINRLGLQVDKILEAGDVKLNMGGEPTFISNRDMESEQWNTEADGEDKRVMALELTHQLKAAFAKQGFLHFGQGKWYPGEPIPRWQYAIYWRKDGQPLWERTDLIGNPTKKGTTTEVTAQQFAKTLATNLGLAENRVLPAYEDRYFYLWEEHNLPVNFDSEKDVEAAKMARQTLVDLLKKDIEKPTGYVLPLRWNLVKKNWDSCRWQFTRENLFLIPGNSQIGLRLPLDNLVIMPKKVEDIVVPANVFEDDEGLVTKAIVQRRIEQRAAADEEQLDREGTFKTALCTQIVNGNLHLFLPPIEDINAFLDLLYTIEVTAKAVQVPVVLEGYQAPYHPDIVKLAVTPDPGVVEVNVHPSASWPQITEVYDTLFQAAESVGLGTNKFMLDGKHTGTGGGNHITLGGYSPAESPMLRRPDLLRSMVNFWQNHPGLSYLFSSQFVGPTSQAPRVDEGRPDILYELDIAFKELERHKNPPFYLVDRIFRNLLTDLTGNTHRAEFCIDKLYSPDSATGRLGILELRGFDMPPHKEMCLVQLLLIRSLVAVFWQHPYKNKLIHWGTDLHNKFMLHHFVKEDIYEVVNHLNRYGVDFQKDWLDCFLEFRFPIYGSVNVEGVNITLRAGIEPWIVLGEEMASSGTARFVDSSVEKLEILVEDFNPERYMVLCNSIKIPLVKTNYAGKYVAAIRYKAWAPPSALHPTIGVNSPLVFDLYDTWNERSVGGCTYYVVHPGGRNYETFPVNSLEAESRRTTRFWEFNHSPKSEADVVNPTVSSGQPMNYVTTHDTTKTDIEVKYVPVSPSFPHTLDLRRSS